MRAFIASLLLATAGTAHADILTRVLADAGGGGTGSAAPATAPAPAASPPSAAEDDLVSWAGQPRAVALGDLLQISIKQAPALAGARIDIRIAEARIGETWARHDWQVQAIANGQRTVSAFVGQAVSSSAYGGSFDLSRALPTGGTIDLHAETDYSKYKSPALGTNELWQDTVSLGITQSLLKGRGVWLYDANERKAQLARDATVLARRLAAIDTVQTVISAYWDLVLAERQVSITEQSLALAKERLRVTEIGAKGGKIAQAEIPAVQQIIATREEDVLNGELAVLNASIALRRAAGMTIGAGDLGLRVVTELDIRDRDMRLGPLVERALGQSPELAQLQTQDKSATIDIEVTENGFLPRLDAALSVGPSGQSGAFNQAWKDLAEIKNLTVTGSLTFQRSLGQNDVRYRARELHATREKLRVNAFDIRAQVAQGVSRAVAGLELAKRRVVLSARAIALAKENIRIETDRFNLGTRTNFDVLNRLEDLRQAEIRQAQAQIDWHKAETVVMALTGDILPAYGITVE